MPDMKFNYYLNEGQLLDQQVCFYFFLVSGIRDLGFFFHSSPFLPFKDKFLEKLIRLVAQCFELAVFLY